MRSNNTGVSNTAIGDSALHDNTEGGLNAAIGASALENSTGNANIALGFAAGSNVTTATDVICIGTFVTGANVDHTTGVGNIYGVTTQSGTASSVIVSDSGQLGTVASSERFEKDIAAMEKASEVILSLRPVTFHYKTDTTGTPQFGLIAEEVAKVNPALVLADKEGKPYTGTLRSSERDVAQRVPQRAPVRCRGIKVCCRKAGSGYTHSSKSRLKRLLHPCRR